MKRAPWLVPAGVGVFVLVMQLVLVAGAGTDIPFQDQWDAEGRLLYPTWRDGTWIAGDFVRPHNEHRILWTKLLDVALFTLNGQWDPLVQLVAGAVLRASIAASLAWMLARGTSAIGAGLGVAVAFLPHLAWHNALWGFQSQVYFVLLFSLAALVALGEPASSLARQIVGLLFGTAALLAMGAGALVPVALLGLIVLRAIEQRGVSRARWREAWPALVLLVTALMLRADAPEHAALRAQSLEQFFNAFARALAWPHSGQPLAALVLCAPLAIAIATRLAGRRAVSAGEDFVLLLGGFAVAGAAAMAWSRGGGTEFLAGVPSRYVDFVVLLPLASGWCAVALARECAERWRARVRLAVIAWEIFLAIGWIGLSTEAMRRIVLPRWRDREAPVRLAVAFQRTDDAGVFANQPRLLVPHPDPNSVRAVLRDPRMQGALPPSLQPDRPMGPLSRAARVLLGRAQTPPRENRK